MSKNLLKQEINTSLKISKNLIQSLDILQFSIIDLEKYIIEESESNPFLLIEDFQETQISSNINSFNQSSSVSHDSKYNNKSDYDILDNICSEESLYEFLRKQIYLEFRDQKEIFIAEYITDLLDDDGYLREKIEDIANSLNIDINIVKSILNRLKKFEPTGVYASSLAECLELQLKDKKLYDQYYKIILNNLALLENHNLKTFSNKCSINYELCLNYIKNIKMLEPKPGRAFSSSHVNLKIPDIRIFCDSSDDIKILLYDNFSNKVKLNNKLLSDKRLNIMNESDQKYVKNNFDRANFIYKSLQQRHETLLKISKEIAVYQKEFFKRGILYLKPMNLSDIAKKISLNESTISRAIRDKYIETEFGIYRIKFFFSSSLKSQQHFNISDGSKNLSSSNKVKALIKSIIDDETKENPLMDSQISELIAKFNIKIARRTISKYRESMNIPSSIERKRNYQKEFA